MARHRFQHVKVEGRVLWTVAGSLSALALTLLGYVVFGTALPGEDGPVADGFGLSVQPEGTAAPAPARTDLLVSDLPFTRAENGLGPVERDRGNGGAAGGDGEALTIKGRRFARGLGVHADSTVQVSLGGRCSRFSATIGVDDGTSTDKAGRGTKVVFLVLADGVVVYRSPELRRGQPGRQVNVALPRAQRLDLVVDDLGYAFGDRADWADARITCTGTPGTPAG